MSEEYSACYDQSPKSSDFLMIGHNSLVMPDLTSGINRKALRLR